MRDWLPRYAEALGARKPLRIPVWLPRLVAGPMVTLMNVQPETSNVKAMRVLSWQPRWRSWREGFREAPR